MILLGRGQADIQDQGRANITETLTCINTSVGKQMQLPSIIISFEKCYAEDIGKIIFNRIFIFTNLKLTSSQHKKVVQRKALKW